MNLTEGKTIENYGKKCGKCIRNTLLPYENEWCCISFECNVTKTKHELSKIQRTKVNFINRIKFAEKKNFCGCIDVYKIYEGIDYDKIHKVLSTLKNKKLKIKNILIEECKDIFQNPEFEQNYYIRTAEGIYKNGHNSYKLMKSLVYFDRS